MLDGLRGREQSCIERWRALVLLHDLLALFDEAHDRVAGLALRRLVDGLENLLEPFDVTFGLALVFLEGGAQLIGIRCP